jgi:hypothetical protein
VAKGKRKATKKDRIPVEPLEAGLKTLHQATQRCVAISEPNIGKIHTGRQRRALFVFSKLIAHNMAIQLIGSRFLENQEGLIDHFSIGVMGRASIDAALMAMYISDPKLNITTWDFRRHLLFLHDANNRNRFLKPLAKQGLKLGFYDNYDEIRLGLQGKIRVLGAQMLFSVEKISDYEKGVQVFVDGVRGAVREAGWDVDMFEHDQSYLSAYVHSHPVSFMRAHEHEIKFAGASRFQIEFCHFVLEAVARYTHSVADRMDAFSVPDIGDPIGHIE